MTKIDIELDLELEQKRRKKTNSLVHLDIQGARHENLDRHYGGVCYVLVEPVVDVTGDVYISGALRGTTLTAGGDVVIDGCVTLLGDLTVGGNLFVRGHVTCGGHVEVKGKAVSYSIVADNGVKATTIRTQSIEEQMLNDYERR